MKMPGFSAEASLFSVSTINHVGHQLPVETIGVIVPQMRPLFNCRGSRGRGTCKAVCYFMGGGMSTESDGSITCWGD